ncbi:Hypothetical Protein RradSPS_2642 [Rubrobacter radiotolerans]|uniref:DUF4382 domain-containing protein n=1 Tax=Rubrobacter radiotolerans TaxID=42256 RepID=A0A023X7A6_RUBRA|nr:hypothetical protein [Rubrobacter radiotolerans]AHY47925.1 Hypothetical Protein RradSPS_2642 [Rubrobacter radiotolerans]MDX5892564.1 hypothetical protein [Rubrobacter radiotolerans]SMC07853.1 conserved hypothetical protein [Rubrobacter radiotolerans DSM 5868]
MRSRAALFPIRKLALAVVPLTVVLAGCAAEESASGSEASGSGELQVRANGEDFVREGFTTKDGWEIAFDNVYVTFAEVTAYQSDPPYAPDSGEEIQASETVEFPGTHTVDLAAGGPEAEPVEVGTVEEAPAGIYNALSWRNVPAESGPAEGASILLVGTAERNGESVDFTIPVEREYEYLCGEFVGEERKGVVEDGEVADLEATFHFDHVFGDAEVPAEDEINTAAVGFDPFAALAENGTLDLSAEELEAGMSGEDYRLFSDELPTLGHTGEGHCLETTSGATG